MPWAPPWVLCDLHRVTVPGKWDWLWGGAEHIVHGLFVRPHLPSHGQGHVVQPPSKDLCVTGRQALDAHQALLFHLPEKQVQALSQAGIGEGPTFSADQGHPRHHPTPTIERWDSVAPKAM